MGSITDHNKHTCIFSYLYTNEPCFIDVYSSFVEGRAVSYYLLLLAGIDLLVKALFTEECG
jgi:hypothetical protein